MCVNTLEQTFFRMVRDIFFVFLLANILFSYENKAERVSGPLTGDEENAAHSDCSEHVLLSKRRPSYKFELSDPEILEKPGVKCEWLFVGDNECKPEIKCSKFKLAEGTSEGDDPCPDEYLQITDGSEGFEKFCGAKGPDKVVPTGTLREIYLGFQGHKNTGTPKNKGFKCVASCSEGQDVKPLEKNMAPEVDKLCDCGRKPNKNRIVGGEDAARGDFPWIFALVTAGTRRPFCGGTLVAPQFIVTAAHCFKGPYVRKDKLELLGNARILDITSTKNAAAKPTPEELARDDAADESHRFKVDKYFLHPLYVRQTNDFDIAIIKLDKPINYVDSPMRPACIPTLGNYESQFTGVQATVAGWGLGNASAEITMAVLQKLKVEVFSSEECKKFFDERINRRMMCAGFKEGGKDSCKGDSGGPLIAEKSKQTWELIGAVSWGEGCAGKALPGVYARITELNQWIRYIINKEGGSWCLSK